MNENIELSNRAIQFDVIQSNTFAQNFWENSMVSRLIVKNFGPIREVDLDLRNVNVFIGPQASGKSAIAKIYTILKAPRKFFKKDIVEGLTDNKNAFVSVLEEYNINSFLKKNTEIRFESELHIIEYKEGTLSYVPKLLRKIQTLEFQTQNFSSNIDEIKKSIKDLGENFIFFKIRATRILAAELQPFELDIALAKLTPQKCARIIDIIKEIEENLSTNAALYIPAERNFINIIKKSSLNLILNKVPIPKHILSFGAELEKIDIKEINLDFIHKDLVYKNINGEDMIYTNSRHSIKLSEAASGIQSVIPILLPIQQFYNNLADHRSFVIEEPELNLFPSAQYELVQLLESNRNESYWEDYGTIHTYTTHSPYILSAINNLLYANKVGNTLSSKSLDIDSTNNIEARIKNIVKADINPYYFTAYQINNGGAKAIFNRQTGLIEENYIDISSDQIADDFEALMELTK